MNETAAASARAAAVFSFTLIAACGDAPRNASGEGHTASASVVTTAPAGSLVVELSTAGTVTAGSTIPIRVTVRNASSRPVDLYLHGREATLDVVARRIDGTVAWQRLAGASMQSILRIYPLQRVAGATRMDGADRRS